MIFHVNVAYTYVGVDFDTALKPLIISDCGVREGKATTYMYFMRVLLSDVHKETTPAFSVKLWCP